MATTTTTEQFSLRWNNFHSNLTAGFHDLLEAAEMVDVTLAVDGHFLQAHKIVLSICSPYFKRMFKVNPCKHPIVIIKDVAHENMKDILEFMYLGEVSVLRENLSSFLRTAELLQVKGLTGDDTSDTSSGKDVKLEGDNEDDGDHFPNYEQMIETEIDSYVQSTNINSQPSGSARSVTNTKRAKNINTNGTSKKSKTNHQEGNAQSTNTPVQNLAVNNSKTESVSSQSKLKSDEGNDSEMMGLNLTNDSSKQTSSTTAQDGNNESDGKFPAGNNWCPPSVGHFVTDGSAEQDAIFMTEKMHVYCPYCCRKFVNRYNLKVHIRDKHESHGQDLDCQICGKTMRNQSCLRVHMYHHRKQLENTAAVVSNTV